MINEETLGLIFEPGGLRVVFQPIFEAIGEDIRIHALECLCRGPKGSAIERADALFRYVRSVRQECAVDRHCILSAFREAALLPESTQMNINVHASTIAQDPDLVNFITWSARAHELDPARIVVEIVQHGPATDNRTFRRRIEELRAGGLQIALDDIGTGYSSYRTVMECRPDYFKIDRYLIAGVDSDPSRQAALRSIVELASGFGSRVIAEGVELGPEFTAVREAGINLVQGFLLAPPREGSSVNFDMSEMRAAS
jgi:EAL domain-containing protein (putative c-di-GMP-specific phosphodiesterase class I)